MGICHNVPSRSTDGISVDMTGLKETKCNILKPWQQDTVEELAFPFVFQRTLWCSTPWLYALDKQLVIETHTETQVILDARMPQECPLYCVQGQLT